MDIVRLGPLGDTTYVPDEMVEGYTSMIWTERFLPGGEFELRTPVIDETLDLLPEKSFISHLETDVVMRVETRNIGVNAEGVPELLVKGRDVNTIFSQRHVESKYQKKRKMGGSYRPAGAAAVLIFNAIDNNTGEDVSRAGKDDEVWTPYPWGTKDKIPGVSVSDSVPSGVGDTKRWWLEEGPLAEQLLNILIKGDLGIRSIRPAYPPSGDTWTIVTVANNAPASYGEITRTDHVNVSQLLFDIYMGVDRSHTQSVNDHVIFNVVHGDFDKQEYLFSVENLKTACEVMSSIPIPDVYRNSADEAKTGWDRLVMSYDAGEPEYPDEPAKPEHPKEPKSTASEADKAQYQDDMDDYRDELDVWQPKHDNWVVKRDNINAEFTDDATDDAKNQLKRQRRTSLFTGDITPFAEYRYKTHYDLGDTVSLFGDYGQVQKMIVSEYVRTEDAEGDRGYPGLVLP